MPGDTVRVYTAARMKQIEDRCVVDARLEPGPDDVVSLILVRNDGSTINVGQIGGIVVDPEDPGGGTGTPGLVTALVEEMV